MQASDAKPVATLAMMAAFADGVRSAVELDQLKQIAETVGGAGVSAAADAASLGATMEQLVAQLSGPDARQLAYEMAVCVCHADGITNPAEQQFLDRLKAALDLSERQIGEIRTSAAALAAAPVGGPIVDVRSAPVDPGPRPSQAGIPALSHDGALDHLILQQSMLTAALELLPENLATLAIIPLQMRLVYRVGADFGQKLDGDQIKDLAGTLGIGAAAQVMQGVIGRVLGGMGRGLLGSMLGGIAAGVADTAASALLTFAATYALGQASKQYYAQGRRLSQDDLRALFARFQEEAKTLYPKVQDEIRAQSSRLNLPDLIGQLKGSLPQGRL